MDRLLLVDGHAILHRAYHAYPPLTTTKGELINAVYGFTSILLSVLKNLEPKYVACAFDLAKPTFRHKEFKAYKAHRPKVDEELKEQIPKAKGVVKALSIPIFEKEGFEADDVIGTIAKGAVFAYQDFCVHKSPAKKDNFSIKTKAQGCKRVHSKNLTDSPRHSKFETIIVTGDKDALQLVDNQIKVFMPQRGKQPPQMYDRKVFLKKYGFEPRQLIDFKALAGDASDGIPGVKGVGPKTATKLIVYY
jgi:DNA polymerase-1